jgi:hypothetical protein
MTVVFSVARWRPRLALASLAVAFPLAAKPVAQPPPPASVELYLDASESMAGYARNVDPDRRPLGDVIKLTQDFAIARASALHTTGFGSESVSITGDLNSWGTADPYECHHVTKCINQQSHLDEALNKIAATPAAGLSVLVSDFWFDNRSFTGTPAVALGGPLRAILANRAIALVGLRVPFKGDVYDMPGIGKYHAAHERVLILFVAGPETKVRAYITSLVESHSHSFDGLHQTFFRSPHAAALTPPAALGAGIRTLRGETGYQINWTTANRQGESRGRLEGDFDIDRILTATVVGRGPLAVSTELRRADTPSTSAITLPGNPWHQTANPSKAHFDFGPRLGPAISGKYMLIGRIGTKGVHSPDPAAQWMREWSLEPNPGRPTFVKAQGLDKLAEILEQIVSRPAWLGQFSVRVDIEE